MKYTDGADSDDFAARHGYVFYFPDNNGGAGITKVIECEITDKEVT